VTDIVENDWPGLVNPQSYHLLPCLRDVDAFVAHIRREDLAGIDPRTWTERPTVSLESGRLIRKVGKEMYK